MNIEIILFLKTFLRQNYVLLLSTLVIIEKDIEKSDQLSTEWRITDRVV